MADNVYYSFPLNHLPRVGGLIQGAFLSITKKAVQHNVTHSPVLTESSVLHRPSHCLYRTSLHLVVNAALF